MQLILASDDRLTVKMVICFELLLRHGTPHVHKFLALSVVSVLHPPVILNPRT